MEKMYLAVGYEMDTKTGNICIVTSSLFASKTSAQKVMQEMYQNALKDMDLTDNNACDEDTGDAVAGGYSVSDECGIYAYAEFAMDQLLEVFYLCVKEIEIGGETA